MNMKASLSRSSPGTCAPYRQARALRACHVMAASSEATRAPLHRRQFLAGLLSLSALVAAPSKAAAVDAVNVAPAAAPDTIYFGSGCFWGRQKDFVDAELQLGRAPEQLSAVAGYAGGTRAGPDSQVCYYYSNPQNVYEKLGHAEVVQVQLSADSSAAAKEFARFSEVYFGQFRKTFAGMMRLDPQDSGPGYRNVVGFAGGVRSPLYSIFKAANVNGMELREGQGNGDGRNAKEDDAFNVVWVVDSSALPFYRAEQYHQYHNEMGQQFPQSYTRDLKAAAVSSGRIARTGCPELPF